MIEPLEDLLDLWRFVRAPADADGMAFDGRFGTETRWFDVLGNYEPSRPAAIDEALDALGAEVSPFTFVDVGSGKGRAVIVASERPFAAVLGVERRWMLHASAVRNVAAAARVRVPRCPVALVCGDAVDFQLPDGPIVLYLYNPFGADVLAALLARIRCEARLVYMNPLCAEVVEAAGWREIARGGAAEWAWRVYAAEADPS